MKAILVIDMPANCMQCGFRDDEGCSIDDYAKSDGSLVIHRHKHDFKRHESCPLKPMPEKKEILDIRDNDEDIYEVFANKMNVGFNRCIDEILGEQENENSN